MRGSHALSVVAETVCGLFVVTLCHADEPAPQTASSVPADCRESFESADLELKPGTDSHLLRARELLRRCASPECKPWMISACTASLADVERRIPTVVLSAHASGKPIVEAEVREREEWLTHRLDGRSIEVEPGEHELVLRLPSGTQVTKRFIVEEGARLKHLEFEVPSAPPAAIGPSVDPPSRSRTPSWLGTAGWVSTTSGLVAIAVGTTFGVIAIKTFDDANCDSRRVCDAEPLERADTAAGISTASFIIGGGLLALGLAAVGLSHWGKASAAR